MTQKSNFPDTPWHVGFAKKDSDDPRRHRSRCIYYSDGCCCCGKSGCYKMKCGGSAHCLFYEEYPLSNNHIYRAGHIKSHTASEKAALTAHYKELNEAEEKLFLRKEVSCFHSLDSISFNEEPDSLFCYHVLKKDGSEVEKYNKRFLYIWIGYDKGGEDHLTDFICRKGYYLYICRRVSNPFSVDTNAGNRKFLLFETVKHTKNNSYKAIEIGITFARDIVEHYMPGILIAWNKIYEPRRPGECLYFYIDSKYSRTFRLIENCEISI